MEGSLKQHVLKTNVFLKVPNSKLLIEMTHPVGNERSTPNMTLFE